MKKIILFFIWTIIISFPGVMYADEMVTVKLKNHIGESETINLEFKGDYFTFDPTVQLEEGVNYSLSVKEGTLSIQKEGDKKQKLKGAFILIPSQYDEEHQVLIDGRPYLGAMEFIIEDESFIRPVNQLPLEDYLKGVVPFEVFSTWGMETLKAQTLAARTYAVSKIDQVIDDTISYQVYGGYTWDEKTTKAVEDTKGEVITFNNRLIETFYSASNGGITENNANVWGGKAMGYFPIKEDPYDPTHPWEFTLHKNQILLEEIDWTNPNWWNELEEKNVEITDSIKRWLYRNGYSNDIKVLSIPEFALSDQQLASKRSIKGSIKVEFLYRLFEGTILYGEVSLKDVNLNRIRPMIGGTIFKSYLIDSLTYENEQYTMKGKGYGHGVGMSQWGAHYMGQDGKSYQEIIAHYYPGTKILDISSEAIVRAK
ncbi:SpoIID/LytB domain-containing protein [Ornithinibacillus halophilus]|uniref:SpoIID/LytB domain protein n=1 Tax=Ornithinibacillus halophilus TaxID=930117 RepID=A0A1M5MLE6_9BACI|nr:SpoIID/LytB domain-containing protein [Ornithinibacillus halophilus]SHG78027.1 SpoIID/LytB domain protein [Ornithinibacillus halophilus]